AALLLDSSIAGSRSPVRPDTPIRLNLRGAGAELRDVRLYRSDQPVPVQVVPDGEGVWRVVGQLDTDSDYRLVVSALSPRPALPRPRPELGERQYRFSTVASPKPSVPTDIVHPRWGEPVSFSWSLPMQSVAATVEPAAPYRVWTEATKTWVQV